VSSLSHCIVSDNKYPGTLRFAPRSLLIAPLNRLSFTEPINPEQKPSLTDVSSSPGKQWPRQVCGCGRLHQEVEDGCLCHTHTWSGKLRPSSCAALLQLQVSRQPEPENQARFVQYCLPAERGTTGDRPSFCSRVDQPMTVIRRG
jgi:hypothetical protein